MNIEDSDSEKERRGRGRPRRYDSDIIQYPDEPIQIEEFSDPIWAFHPHLGETEDYYKQFLIYASIAPSQRGLQEVWESWSGKKTMKSGTFNKTASRFQWSRRASAWDIQKLQEVQNDWIMRDERRREEDYALGDLMRIIARDKLNNLADDPSELTANQAARFAELASSLQEKAIPTATLDQDEIKQLINALPAERQKKIVGILIAKS